MPTRRSDDTCLPTGGKRTAMVTWSAPRSPLPALAALLALLVSVPPGHAACDPSSDPDESDIANARAAVAANCDCAGATNHGAYVSCAVQQADAALTNKGCARFVKRCASRSTCGRPGFVTCCRTNSQGVTRCAIKSSASACVAPRGGSRCVGERVSCCDACAASGCASTVTTTTTPGATTTTTLTATSTSTTSTTFPACSELLGHCGASSCSGACVAHQPDNALECVDTFTCQNNPGPSPCSSDADCSGGGACFSDGSGHTACCTSGCACTPTSCLGSTTTTTLPPGCTAATVGTSCGSCAGGGACTVLCSDNCTPQCVMVGPSPICQTDADCVSTPGARCVTDHPAACSQTSGSCPSGGGRCEPPCQ